MIKPINISPLNTSKELYFKCEKCGTYGNMYLTNFIINTDNQGNPEANAQLENFKCPRCGNELYKRSKN